MKEPIDDRAPLPDKGTANLGWRAFKCALIGAILAVAGAVLLAALNGFFFGLTSAFYGTYEPGWKAAANVAMIVSFPGGIQIGGTGFVIGLIVGLVKNGLRSGR